MERKRVLQQPTTPVQAAERGRGPQSLSKSSKGFRGSLKSENCCPERRKNDPAKLALAARLRRETTLPLKWITARVRLGTSKSANAKLHRWLRSHPEPAIAASEKAKTHETTKTNQAMG